MDCGVHDDLDLVVADPEEFVGLDDLEALVHQRAGVDGDLRAHLPGRMGQGIGDGDRFQLSSGAAPEGSAASRQDDGGHPIRMIVGPQALVNGAVLGVDRNDLGPRIGADPLNHRSGRDQRLLVGQPEPLARLQGRQRHRQPGESDYSVDDRVGGGGRGRHRVLPGEQLHAGRQQLGQSGGAGRVGQRDDLRPEAMGLLGQQLHRAGCSQRDHAVSVGPGPHDVERLGSNRSGRAQNSDRRRTQVSSPWTLGPPRRVQVTPDIRSRRS